MKSHEQWLVKASSDYQSALKLFAGESPIFDTAIYHAQQTAEKALKAFLAFKEQALRKTHDLELLVTFCSELDDSFSCLLPAAEVLTPYATTYRYPDMVLCPEQNEVAEAIKLAGFMLDFVRQRIMVASQKTQ